MQQYVDGDLAFYFLASAGMMLVYVSGREPGAALLAGALAGLSAWTKNEGLTFVLLSLAIWVWVLRADRPGMFRFITGLAIPMLVVMLFKLFLAPENDIFEGEPELLPLLTSTERYPMILKTAVTVFRDMIGSPVPVLGALLLYALAMGRGRDVPPAVGPAALLLIGQLATYFAIFLITPRDVEWHVRSSIGRLYLHLAPLMLLVLFLWLRSPDEPASSQKR
jgi:hypothetical protein